MTEPTTASSRTDRIVADGLVLEPLDAAVAQRIIDGGAPDQPVGAGWPQAGTMSGLAMARTGKSRVWLVIVDGVVVGDAGTHGAVDEAGEVEIGYGLAAPSRGRGHGRTLVRALTEWLLGQPGVRAVIAETEPDNLPSRRSLESAGFQLVSADAQGAHYRRNANATADTDTD